LALVALAAMGTCADPPRTDPGPSDLSAPRQRPRILVFSRTTGFRHDSISAGVQAVREICQSQDFEVIATEDAAAFARDTLAGFAVIVFLNTSGDVLDDFQQAAFERYIRGGGGFVGVHAAADTEHDWAWFGLLVGARFKSHPAVQPAILDVVDAEHPAMRLVPRRWPRTDEWYNFHEPPRASIRVLLRLDESTYSGGEMPGGHPAAWCHEFEGGRAFYTAGGHTSESFAEPLFRQHLLGAIRWAAGLGDAPAAGPASPHQVPGSR
jgi:type 1 glutamine amidotransferase